MEETIIKKDWEKAFSEAMENEELDLSERLCGKYKNVLKAMEAYLDEAEKVYFRAGYRRGRKDAARKALKI